MDNSFRSALSLVNIKLAETNTRPPVFDSSIYTVSLFENSPMDTLVVRVHATDADANRLTYLIDPDSESSASTINRNSSSSPSSFPFRLDKHTGEMRVNGRLDYEMKSDYTLDVLARDLNFTARARVRVQVKNVVDKAPYFEYNYYSFKIKVPYDVYIGQIRAIDVEHTGNLTYSIEFERENDSRLFCIMQTGTIYVCASLLVPATLHVSLEDVMAQFKQPEYKYAEIFLFFGFNFL